MTDRIFLVMEDSSLEAMDASPYENEDVFQELVEKYPDLLVGEQISPGIPRRWLLVKREMGIPDNEEGKNRWSIDHLFLDQDGIPTLVEIKRAQDSRIRREVVGQVLDYAANAVLHWSIDEIRKHYEATSLKSAFEPRERLMNFLEQSDEDQTDDAEDPTAVYWSRVKTNLEAGRLRLIFVADKIPTELENIVSFLNRQMNPCEVLAVEMRQFVGRGLKTIAPRVLGHTPESRSRKSTSGTSDGRDWTETEFFERLGSRSGDRVLEFARRIVDHVGPHADEIRWGLNTAKPSCQVWMRTPSGQPWKILSIWINGVVASEFGSIKKIPPFDQPAGRAALLSKLNELSDKSLVGNELQLAPLDFLLEQGTDDQYLRYLDWVRAQIAAAGS